MRSTGGEHVVLDVREARELDICQLEGALHIPMAEIPARVNDLPTNQPLVVLCHHGARSQMVVDFLRDAGFDNAVNLDGGIEALRDRPNDAALSLACIQRGIATHAAD
jgi:rhodanese-related sulfurtransferase